MGPDRNKHLRNIGIILLLALVVWQLPGGETGADTIFNILAILFWGGLVFLAYRLYMEHRTSLLTLEDRTRATLYVSMAVIGITLVATSRMWGAGGLGALAWMVLVGLGVYGLVSVFRAAREY